MRTIDEIRASLKMQDTILKQFILERENVIDVLNVALLCNQHICLISLPGTAKSQLGEYKKRFFVGMKFAENTFNSYTVPADFIGQLSMVEMQKDRRIYCVDNFVPSAHIAILNEVFKADKQLSALLDILNERTFRQNGVPTKCPLISALLFSNEMPADKENNPFWDRVFFRFKIGYCSDSDSMDRIIAGNFGKINDHPDFVSAQVTLDELYACQAEVEKVKIGTDCLQAIRSIFRLLRTEGIACSDRQLNWAGQAVKAHAFLNGKTVADAEDVIVLENTLWNDPESHIHKVQKTVADFSNPQLAEITRILTTTTKVYQRAITTTEERRKQAKELAELFKDLESMKDTVSPRNIAEYNRAHNTCRLNTEDVTKTLAGMVA